MDIVPTTRRGTVVAFEVIDGVFVQAIRDEFGRDHVLIPPGADQAAVVGDGGMLCHDNVDGRYWKFTKDSGVIKPC